MFRPFHGYLLYEPQHTDGIVPGFNVDYRLFHDSLLEMNERIRSQRDHSHGATFPSLRSQDTIHEIFRKLNERNAA